MRQRLERIKTINKMVTTDKNNQKLNMKDQNYVHAVTNQLTQKALTFVTTLPIHKVNKNHFY